MISAVTGHITLGDMTLSLLVFKQGQSALAANLSAVGGMYEDTLYLSNLYEYLEHQSAESFGTAVVGTSPGDGVRKLWDPGALRRWIGVIFQDFIRYQPLAGENIGAGDVAAFEDRLRWQEAAAMGMRPISTIS